MLKVQKLWAFSPGVVTGGIFRDTASEIILSTLLGLAGSAPRASKPLRDQLQVAAMPLPTTHFILATDISNLGGGI